MTAYFAAGFRAGIEAAAKKCDGLVALNRAYAANRDPNPWHTEAVPIYADAANQIRALPVPDGESTEADQTQDAALVERVALRIESRRHLGSVEQARAVLDLMSGAPAAASAPEME